MQSTGERDRPRERTRAWQSSSGILRASVAIGDSRCRASELAGIAPSGEKHCGMSGFSELAVN